MAIPAMGALAAAIYHELRLIVPDDEANGWPFANYIAAMFSPGENVESWARDTDAGPGWSILVNLARCPIIALPWLGQINGVEIPPSLDSSLWRAYIGSARGMQRHSPDSLVAAGQAHLTGTKSVRVLIRQGPSAYDTTIITRTSETPNPAQTLSDLLAAKRVGLRITHVVSDAPLIDEFTRPIDSITAVIDSLTLADVT